MLHILQTVYDPQKQQHVLFLGMNDFTEGANFRSWWKYADGTILSFNTATPNFLPIRSQNGTIEIGKTATDEGTVDIFFGCIREEFWERLQPDTNLDISFT